MAWPSGTKAGTTNVDQGTDKISLARPDIKQNIDNVNTIIDHYSDTGGPYSSVGTYTAQQSASLVTLTAPDLTISGPQVAWDLNTAQVAKLTNSSSTKTYSINITNGIAGGTYILIIHNNTSVNDNVFNLSVTSGALRYPGGVDVSNLVQPNTRTVITLLYDGTDFLVTYANGLN